MSSLNDALAAARAQIATVRETGLAKEADLLERQLAPIEAAARPFTDWLSESEAVLMSGRSADWHRHQFASLQARGLARMSPTGRKSRQYLRCAVPQRANLEAAKDAGRRGERVG